LLVALLVLGLFFHTNVQLDDWMEEWSAQADYGLTAQLLADLADMSERHPWYFDPQPASTTTTRSTPSTWSGSVEQWRPLVASHFAANKVNTAMCLLAYETGFTGDPNSKNQRSSAAGLFQFLRSTWDNMVPREVTGGSYDSGMVYQPEANVRAAAWLQNAAGWTQWSPYNRGECRGL